MRSTSRERTEVRYVLVASPTVRLPERSVVIGVIVQGEGEIRARFTNDLVLYESTIGRAIPKTLFENLQPIFDRLIYQGEVLPSRDDSGEIVPVKVTEPRFFDLLRQWQGSHLLFSDTEHTEATSINEAISRLYDEYVGKPRVSA